MPRWIEGDDARYIAWERFTRGPNLTIPKLHRIVLRLVPAPSPEKGETHGV